MSNSRRHRTLVQIVISVVVALSMVMAFLVAGGMGPNAASAFGLSGILHSSSAHLKVLDEGNGNNEGENDQCDTDDNESGGGGDNGDLVSSPLKHVSVMDKGGDQGGNGKGNGNGGGNQGGKGKGGNGDDDDTDNEEQCATSTSTTHTTTTGAGTTTTTTAPTTSTTTGAASTTTTTGGTTTTTAGATTTTTGGTTTTTTGGSTTTTGAATTTTTTGVIGGTSTTTTTTTTAPTTTTTTGAATTTTTTTTAPTTTTPGGFLNRSPAQWRQTVPTQVMGTRCHELAKFVVYDSPLQVVSDHPDHYRNQPGLEFLRVVPTVWDETEIIDGQVGEFILSARRSGSDWFLGGMTNEKPRTLRVPLGFLGKGAYIAHIFADAPDSAENAEHLTETRRAIRRRDILTIRMAPSGGIVLHFRPGN